MKLRNAPSQYGWIIGSVIVFITMLPWFLTQVGMGFGSASQGGAGAHFAGISIKDFIYRFDVNSLALVVIILTMTLIYNRLKPSRFVLILGLTLVVSGFNDSIHIIPIFTPEGNQANFQIGAMWSTTLSRSGSALILLLGIVTLRFGHHFDTRKTSFQILLPSIAILAMTRASMFELVENQVVSSQTLNICTIVIYLLSGITLRSQIRSFNLRFFGHGVLAMLIPLLAGVVWLLLSVESIYDQGFHIAILLKWFAWLIPATGLGIDYVNTFYAMGMSTEKRFLRAVIDSIPHFIFSRDLNGRFTLVNKAVADFYGMKVHQIEGRLLTQIHDDPSQCRQWIKEDRDTLERGEQWEIPETSTIDANGKQVWITAIKRPLKSGFHQEDQILGVSINMTQQKQAELALSKRLEMERMASSILESFVHCTNEDFHTRMVSILDDICQYTQASRGFLFEMDEETGSAALLFKSNTQDNPDCSSAQLPDELDAKTMEWMKPWLDKHVPIATERMDDLPEEAKDFCLSWGNKADSSFMIVPILYHGEVFGFLGVDSCSHGPWEIEELQFLRNACDLFITVYSKLESERSLVQAMEDAQASSRAKSEFLANMSHEIRTPMNCVIGISDLLREMDPAPAQKQYLDMIHQSGNTLLDLINDILDLSKIEAGQLDLDLTLGNLHTLVEEVSGLIAFSAQTKGLEVICRLAPGVPENTTFDAGRLRQVLTNLLNNATKFTREGHIYINIEPVGEKDGQVLLRFQINDTGIGVSPSQLAKIFDKFTQADASTTRRFGGTGLGLSITQHLVNLMGGKVTASSEEGVGSTFEFTIPLPISEHINNPPSMVEPENAAKVLVITESVLSGEVLAEQVRALGHDCSIAQGCDEAMKLFPGTLEKGSSAWDYVLLDQAATKQETPLIIENSALNQGKSKPQVVIMTAISSTLRETELRRQGFSGSLSKPVRPVHLVNLFQGQEDIFAEHVETIVSAGSLEDMLPRDFDQSPQPETGPRILLAEDNPFNQKVAVGMLNLLGCSVEVASNGIEAVEMIQHGNYDLVFMDCQMPEMDGYEATRQIRKLAGDSSTTPIIAMTANALSGDRNECFAVGMNDFLSKPINKAMLNDMLQKWELIKSSN